MQNVSQCAPTIWLSVEAGTCQIGREILNTHATLFLRYQRRCSCWDLIHKPLVLAEGFAIVIIHLAHRGGMFCFHFFLKLQRLCSRSCGILYVYSKNRHEISIPLNILSRATVHSGVVWRWVSLYHMKKRCRVYAWHPPHVTKRIGVYVTRMSFAPFSMGRLEFFKEIW
jgi:hypothetical protein